MGIIDNGHAADPVLTRLVNEDTVPWYKRPNLRKLYVWLFLCCMGVEMTSGFDSQLINTLQFSGQFNKCEHSYLQTILSTGSQLTEAHRLWKWIR